MDQLWANILNLETSQVVGPNIKAQYVRAASAVMYL
jgi:hypothetical protein